MQWWLLSIAVATQGRASAGDAPLKILHAGDVYAFLGVRGGKKRNKIPRCVSEVHFGKFIVECLLFFSVFAKRENTVIYSVFVPLA